MVSALNSALSGLAAATTRLGVSASNTANQFSTKSEVDGQITDKPYTPQKVDQISLTNGGVQTKLSDVSPATQPLGDQQLPNVSSEQEAVNQITAAYDFKANLKTIKVQDNILKSLLDIKS